MSPSFGDGIYDAIGVTGSLLAAFAPLPNIVRIHKRNQTKDISYTYQVLLATGIFLLDVYYAYYKSVLVFPISVSLIFILYTIGLKCCVEMFRTPREVTAGGRAIPEHFEHTVLLKVAERSDDKGDMIDGYGAAHRVAPRAGKH